MAKRISGSVSVRLTFDDAANAYKCTVSTPTERPVRVEVRNPAFNPRPVDSPESYDQAARAAIAFAGFMGEAEIEMLGRCTQVKLSRLR